MIDDRRFLGDPDRILGGADVTESTDVHVLHHRRPACIQNTGIRADFVSFGMQVVFDGRGPPHAHLVRLTDDLVPLVDDVVVNLAIVSQRPLRLAPRLTVRRKHRIQLKNDFR